MNDSNTILQAAAVQAGAAAQPRAPSIDALQRDIAFANSYRLELVKLLMTLCAALFAFTVTFRPDLGEVFWSEAMWFGWGGLAASMLGGAAHMYAWDRYYMTYRDCDHKYRYLPGPINGAWFGARRRKRINFWRKAAMFVQFTGFCVGVAGVGLFAAANVDGKRHDGGTPASSGKASAVVGQVPNMAAASGKEAGK